MGTSIRWFYYKNDQRFGPVAEVAIRGLLRNGAITADTLVWRDGLDAWTKAQSTELLSDAESALSSLEIGPALGTDAETESLRATIAPEDAAFERLVSGLPEIATTIVNLPAANRETALRAVERSYYELAAGWGYPQMRAKKWASLVMVMLQREIEDQTTTRV